MYMALEGKEMMRNHGRNVRCCTEQEGPVLKELCRSVSQDLEALMGKGGNRR